MTTALLILLAIGIAIIIIWYLSRPPAMAASPVRRENVERILAVTGLVSSTLTVQVAPLVNGIITQLNFDTGDLVSEGAIMARLDDTEARARVSQAEAQLESHREDLAFAETQARRMEDLYRSGAVSRNTLDEARLARDRARAAVSSTEAMLEEAQNVAAHYAIEAPMEGLVTSRPVDVGQTVAPGATIFEMAGGDRQIIKAGIDERFLSELHTGLKAKVAPMSSDQHYHATLSAIDPGVDPATGSARVEFTFDDEAPADLVLGLSVNVNVTVARHTEALTVPRQSVAGLDSEPWVLCVDDGVARRLEVGVIDWPAPRIVVTDGLDGCRTVLLNPTVASPGQRVRPVMAPVTDDESVQAGDGDGSDGGVGDLVPSP